VKTEDLIGSLVESAAPVKRLHMPPVRLLFWLGLSFPWIALIAWVYGPRTDLAAKVQDITWLTEQSLALATAIAAGLAALCACVPGRPIWERLMPIVPLTLWIGMIVDGCVRSILAGGPWSSLIRLDIACLPQIAMLGLVPAVAMIGLVRKGAPVAPYTTVAYASLAATALAAFGLRFYHAEDASLMILVWQMGSVALLTGVFTLLAPRLLPWRISTLPR
jgi:hypothetical protein